MKVILDTNILLAPGRTKTDVFRLLNEEQLQPCTLSGVVRELEQLASGKGKDGAAARLALALLEKNTVEVIPSSGHVDEELVKAARVLGCIVCTLDKKLLAVLKKNNIAAYRLSKGRFV